MGKDDLCKHIRVPRLNINILNWLPSRGNVVFATVLIVGMLGASRAGALTLAAPTVASTATIPYQGRLTNTNGTPRNGLTNMEFRLYNVPSGGSALWTESWTSGNAVRVSDGMFSILLGSLNNTLSNVVQANSQLWLGITVNTDSEMSPRVQLGSAAYALQALTVPDGSIGTAKISDGAVMTSKLGDGAITTRKTKSSIYTVSGGQSLLSTYDTWVDLPPLSIAIPAAEVPVTTKALVLFDARCISNVDTMAITFLVAIDGGTSQYVDIYPRSNQMLHVGLHDVIALSPNTNHVVKMRWRIVLASGTANCDNTKLTVILLGQ